MDIFFIASQYDVIFGKMSIQSLCSFLNSVLFLLFASVPGVAFSVCWFPLLAQAVLCGKVPLISDFVPFHCWKTRFYIFLYKTLTFALTDKIKFTFFLPIGCQKNSFLSFSLGGNCFSQDKFVKFKDLPTSTHMQIWAQSPFQ